MADENDKIDWAAFYAAQQGKQNPNINDQNNVLPSVMMMTEDSKPVMNMEQFSEGVGDVNKK